MATPEVVAELKKREGVSVRETDDGKVEIAVTGRVDGGLERGRRKSSRLRVFWDSL
jgi:type III restriction enzyme